MKNTSYKFLILFIASILVTACGNKNGSDGHTQKTEAKESQNEGEEVVLSKQQFNALKMKIDTLTLRNMSGYVEANGTLEVPPQNEAAITSVVGANVCLLYTSPSPRD